MVCFCTKYKVVQIELSQRQSGQAVGGTGTPQMVLQSEKEQIKAKISINLIKLGS